MPDAKIMAGVNVTTAQISPFGQYVLTRMGSTDAGLQSLITETGFDPRRDVTEILMASNGNTASPGGLLLARGSFKVDQLVAAVSKDKKTQVAKYNGATLITGMDANSKEAFAFIGTSVALAGDLASVKAAIDRSGRVNSVTPELATRVQALSTTEDAWSVSLASIGSLIPNMGDSTTKSPGAQTFQMVKNIQSSSGGVKFGSTVDIVGQAVSDTPQNATALADIIRMVSSLVAMGAAQDPAAGAAAQLIQKIKITTNGAAVDITASIPEADLEGLLKTLTSQSAARATEGSGRARKL
ncbi:MAG: hypothetical protein M3N54_11540 [Acidobacteriota bacterium]|nr:hypothetical protein [Acidobacteriota bacterium]